MSGSVGSAARAALYASKASDCISSDLFRALQLFQLPAALLVGEREVHQRDGVVGEKPFERAEDLDRSVSIAVARLEDPRRA